MARRTSVARTRASLSRSAESRSSGSVCSGGCCEGGEAVRVAAQRQGRKIGRRAPAQKKRSVEFYCARLQRALSFPLYAEDAKLIFRKKTREAQRNIDTDFDAQSSDELIREAVAEKSSLLLKQIPS